MPEGRGGGSSATIAPWSNTSNTTNRTTPNGTPPPPPTRVGHFVRRCGDSALRWRTLLAMGKSRIAFTWLPQTIEGTTTLTVAVESTGDEIPAAFVEKSVEVSKVFTAETKATTPQPQPSTPTVPTFTGKARGKVTITNRYSKAQPLTAGTRLKSPDGQIFRTQTRVDVPVGGSVTTEVVADVAGEAGSLPKGTTFILPALWAGLQDKITGISTEAFHDDDQSTATTTSTNPGLTANELANAEQVLLQEAITQALPDLQKLVPTGRTLYPGLVDATTVKRTDRQLATKLRPTRFHSP